MTIFVYDTQDGQVVEQHEASGYDNTQLFVNDTVIFHRDGLEYSLVSGQQQALRAKYNMENMSDSTKIEQLEELLVEIIYGGESA